MCATKSPTPPQCLLSQESKIWSVQLAGADACPEVVLSGFDSALPIPISFLLLVFSLLDYFMSPVV